jgi:hypothetical protein
MITEGSTPSGSVRFKLDGNVKTVNKPVTGAALHVLAGNPASLVGPAGPVPNDHEPYDLPHDAELHSKHHLAQPQRVPAEQVMPGGPPGVDPGPPVVDKHHTPGDREKILDEVAAGHGGPYADHDPAKSHDPVKAGPAPLVDLPAAHGKV